MRVRVGCEFQFQTEHPVTTVMLVGARTDAAQHKVHESRWTTPELRVHDFPDAFGNTCWRMDVPTGDTTVRYDALVDVANEPDHRHPDAVLVPPARLPNEVLGFTLPSRYVDSDRLANEAWSLFGDTPNTWERPQAVCDWVHANVRYDPYAIVHHGSARELYERRVGVCRDFALLVAAFCRALNIPARYTFGYLPDVGVVAPETPMDFHAWTEVFIDGRWYTFDARHNTARTGRVIVGFGRDATDVALTTSYGALSLRSMQVWADQVAVAPEEEAFLPGTPVRVADKPEYLSHEQLLGVPR